MAANVSRLCVGRTLLSAAFALGVDLRRQNPSQNQKSTAGAWATLTGQYNAGLSLNIDPK